MASSLGSGGLLPGRRGRLYIAAAVVGLLVLVVWLFLFIDSRGCIWCSGVIVDEAFLISPNRLDLIVGSCNASPKVSLLVESDTDVQIKAVVTPPRLIALSGNDCQDVVEVQLARPLGDRVIIDRHTGQTVRVRDRSRTSQ